MSCFLEKSDLTKLLQDLKAKTIELKTQLQPVMQKLADGEIKTSKGVSFLEVKYQIMIQYILQLTFYVHLKLSGKQVENHPVVKSLVELRVILDKMKPIEVKLKYQIDKLVRTAVMGTQKAETGAVTSATAVANDPLAFKPNPMNLLNRNDDDNEEEEDDDTNAKLGVYRPPKLAPVNYDAGKDRKSKEERNEERLKEKASRSRVMKDLMAEMNDAPEEVDVRGGVNEGTGYGDRVDSLIAEKSQYEENNYVRLAVTRKEKKRMQSKNKMRFESEFDNLNDFSNLAGIQDVEEQENERFRNVLNRKSQRAERDVDDIESAMSHGNKRSRQGDEQFHGVLDGKQGGRNKFKRARKVQGRTKKNGQF
ncbi:Sas10/Utp3/C1D family-domain-containing protein [Phycomyces nitens]|nr:Sas10/Utp3/C1D family-domain-containing protein [Phycomyces nitens]